MNLMIFGLLQVVLLVSVIDLRTYNCVYSSIHLTHMYAFIHTYVIRNVLSFIIYWIFVFEDRTVSPLSGYSHEFRPNNGAGSLLDANVGLFNTWQFSLYRSGQPSI